VVVNLEFVLQNNKSYELVGAREFVHFAVKRNCAFVS